MTGRPVPARRRDLAVPAPAAFTAEEREALAAVACAPDDPAQRCAHDWACVAHQLRLLEAEGYAPAAGAEGDR